MMEETSTFSLFFCTIIPNGCLVWLCLTFTYPQILTVMRMVINLGELRIITNRRARLPTPPLQPIVGTDYRQSSERIAANRRKAMVESTNGQECDAVIHLRNGKYGLIEIKLGGDKLIEYGTETLKSMEAKIDTEKMNSPSFLMVLTGTGDWAYRRKDGVYVVPIGCLKN